jgi:hypothetical protein
MVGQDFLRKETDIYRENTMKNICLFISKVTFGKICLGWCKK